MNNLNYKECFNDHFRDGDCLPRPLTINENPTILDKILFRFKTTKSGANCDFCCGEGDEDYCEEDCLDPFTFDDITIYYIERNFSNKSTYVNDDSIFHYSDAVVVYKIGSPLWMNNSLECPPSGESKGSPTNYEFCQKLSCPDTKDQIAYKRNSKDEQDPDNLILKKLEGRAGCFEFVWSPEGIREGDYFICWTYTPYRGSSKISSHQKFYLNSSTAVNTSTLIHRTNPQKYLDLLERYTPEMFKAHISESDLTPIVIEKLNRAIARGFNVLEDLTNQLVDLLDSNSVNEYIIYYLSNTLNLNLKSRDPILWRRQIKEAVPLFKKKGTQASLKQAFDQAGMKLIRTLNYWQVVSPYYFVDSFIINSNNNAFELSKKMVGDEIKITNHTHDSFVLVSREDFEIVQEEFVTKIVLLNNYEIDSVIKVEYFYNLPKSNFDSDLFEYIQHLPLMDTRDSFVNGKPIIPLKNWNTKLIEENDPFIDHIIKTRHPFTDQIVFGKIKTEFPYSENIYNMEEYNGSIRDSKNPCDIDRDFLDPCTSCRSSNFDVDLEIEDLCDDRIVEARQIIAENTPLHSILRTINYFGGNNEYFVTPLEHYEILINYKYLENNISGGLQRWFHRGRLKDDLYKRDELSTKSLSFSSNVSFYNEKVSLFCADLDFNNIPENSFVEILSPSIYFGNFSITGPNNNFVDIQGINLVNNSTFIFNVYSELDVFSTELIRDDYLELLEEDSAINFLSLGVDNLHQVLIDNNFYEIKEIYSNKIILKNNENKIDKSFQAKYKIFDKDQKNLELKKNNNTSFGKITYLNRTKVIKSLNIEEKKYYDLKLVFNKNGITYSCDFINYDNDYFYIKGYFGEDIGSLEVKLLNYFSKGQIGSLSFSGMKCLIQGSLSQDFLNNYSQYAIRVVSQNFSDNYYFISDLNFVGGEYILDLYGDFENFGLIQDKVQSLCEFYKYRNNNMTIEEQNRELDQIEMEIKRSNASVVQKSTEIKCEGKTDSGNENQIVSFSKNSGPVETSIQKENIFVIIQDINGKEKEVNL